ncbi:uncharacterized protein LOC129580656 [Paramacrobiotus metropolitanus]|uniref:uncharacterized protein LOC129580656 n=1 Tax=Paramacrobiotus metropolitanus TaxID=2943436 RepID=UPI002445EF63|nr:uncharacterized protein LOC129580656 [Paramacrobiotus metropolitanus]XP_055327264.1 uncharacterized protein LOC129580656 [Paramacrobiotus metropolitanus]
MINGIPYPKMDAYAIVALTFFIISIILVIFPIAIPIPRTRLRLILDTATAPLVCVIILALAQCIPFSVFRDGIVGAGGIKPYNIMILFFSLAYMAISLDLTGLLQAAAFWIANHGGRRGIRLYTSFYLFSTVLSILLGNDPVVLSGTAFLVYYTAVAKMDPYPWLFAEFASCNIGSMVLFLGNITNLVLCEGFQMEYLMYTAYTTLPFLGCAVAAYTALLVQFRKQIPQQVTAPQLDARSVLLDPVSALVGSGLLLSCLIVIIGASFGGVDVWVIALPFTIGKFLFDIIWEGWIKRRPSSAAFELELRERASVRHSTEAEAVVIRRFSQKWFTTHFRWLIRTKEVLKKRFPTAYTSLKRLPIGLLPFALSQFVLVEALAYHKWIDIFAGWMAHLTTSLPATVFSVGLLSVVLCNFAGTNILATVLLTKILRQIPLDDINLRGSSIALAVGSNIGAVSFTFSASLAGLLWRNILWQKGLRVRAVEFFKLNLFPILLTSAVGFSIVYAEMIVCSHIRCETISSNQTAV